MGPRRVLAALGRLASRISIRLLAFNVLLVFLPAAGLLYLDTYEQQLLAAQEGAMVQQGRVLAAALSGGEMEAEEARRVLSQLGQRTTARLRVLDRDGLLLADSSLLGPRRETEEEPLAEAGDARANWLYRLGAILFNLLERARGGDGAGSAGGEFYSSGRPFDGAEVRAALAGRYGAATRVSPGQRSVTLYSALPIYGDGREGVVGAVLVSRSTLRLLRDLYEVRLAVFRVVLASVAAAVVLSLLVSGTIARPIDRLRREAAAMLDRRGRLRGRFSGSRRRDEIGDLARALEELSRRLEEHLRFTETFAADLSHEFKNPLAAIRAATELLAEAEEPEERRRFLAMVLGDVARLERLLAAAREITTLDARLEGEERQPLDLVPLLAGLAEAFRLRGAGRGVGFELAVPEGPVAVSGAADRLVQAFENLLANALSFSPPGGTVRLSLERRGGEAVVAVADEGPGVPAEHRERVFQRFFSHRPRAEGGGGRRHAGLGLAIVRAVVEGHGGGVSVAEAAGGGALFEVRLPLAGAGS